LLLDRVGPPTLVPVGEQVLVRSTFDLGAGAIEQHLHMLAAKPGPLTLLGTAPDPIASYPQTRP